MPESEFFTLDEFCRLTGWKRQTVYCYLNQKKHNIPARKFGRFLRFKKSESIDFVNNMTQPIA